jgi:outer membrane protein OmpA-like peptidoglycan-associated protein
MRVSVSLSLSTALFVVAGMSAASAMDANEIFNRLKAQANDAPTSLYQGESATRGMTMTYGADRKAPVPAETAPALPSVQAAPARPGVVDTTSYVTVTEPASAPMVEQPKPAYTIISEPTESGVTPFETVTAPAAPQYVPAQPARVQMAPIQTAPVTPTYQAEPAYTVVETPKAIPVATRAPSADSYSQVAEDKRVDLRIYFEWNSASLKPEAVQQLSELCSAIRRVGASPDNRFKIIGHTDKSGTYDYNLYLSNARAKEVKRHLVESCALPAESLLAVGEGERQSSPTTPSNAPQERRVEIQFVS